MDDFEWDDDGDDELAPRPQCHTWQPHGRRGHQIYTWKWRDALGNSGWLVAGRCPVCHTMLTIDGEELEDGDESED